MTQSITERLVTANHIVANENIISGFGHVSVRNPEADTMFISRSLSPAFVTADDILEVTLEGEVLDDERTTYLENVIHRAIYRARPDVNAVIHHHAPEIMPFTVTDVEFRPVFHKGMLFYGGVPKFDAYDEEHGWLIVTEDEGERMARNLGNHRAQLLEGHGANNVGTSLKELIYTTYSFLLNAQHQIASQDVGEITFDPQNEAMVTATEDIELSDVAVDRLWDYLTRRLPDSA